jgi:hypothetical protein
MRPIRVELMKEGKTRSVEKRRHSPDGVIHSARLKHKIQLTKEGEQNLKKNSMTNLNQNIGNTVLYLDSSNGVQSAVDGVGDNSLDALRHESMGRVNKVGRISLGRGL